jgi:K+-transporting ATPase ATPase C chain
MRDVLRPALAAVGLLTIALGLVVPLGFTGLAWLLLPHQAGGSLLAIDGRVGGSALIGQAFAAERYFHPRPSATIGPDPDSPGGTRAQPYNGAASGASNLGPSSAALLAAVRARIALAGPAPVPADAATASASGLDPHVSPASALRQVPRVAAARGLPPEQVARLVRAHTEGRELGLLGEKRVHVLRLNLALDAVR